MLTHTCLQVNFLKKENTIISSIQKQFRKLISDIFKKLEHTNGLTHFDTYKSEPSNDCNCLFEQDFWLCYSGHIYTMVCNFSGGSDVGLVSVLTSMLKETIEVVGANNVLRFISKPN